MAKTVPFNAKPTARNATPDPEAWVSNTTPNTDSVRSAPSENGAASPLKPMKRLTIDISEDLHRRIKIICAQEGTRIADEVRSLLEKRFQEVGS